MSALAAAGAMAELLTEKERASQLSTRNAAGRAWSSTREAQRTPNSSFRRWFGGAEGRAWGCFTGGEDVDWRARFQVVFVNSAGRPEQGQDPRQESGWPERVQDAGGLFKEFWEKQGAQCMAQGRAAWVYI